jgi:chromosome segregation ATPase
MDKSLTVRLKELDTIIGSKEKKLSELKKILEESRKRLDEINVGMIEADQTKANMLSRYVVGEATESELEKAKNHLENLAKQLVNMEELHNATENARTRLKNELPLLQNEQAAISRRIWLSVVEAQKAELRKTSKESVIKTLAAVRLAGNNWHHPGAVFDLFFDSGIDAPELGRFEAELLKKYL